MPRFSHFSLALLFGMFLLVTGCGPSGPEPDWQTMPNAQKLAEANSKKVVVAIYTDWCGWCKKLEKDVYPDELVASIIDEYFYLVRLNAESDEEIIFNGHRITMRNFAQQLGVTSYPTTVFLDATGKTIGQQQGYMEAEVFGKLLAFVGSDSYRRMQFDEFTVAR